MSEDAAQAPVGDAESREVVSSDDGWRRPFADAWQQLAADLLDAPAAEIDEALTRNFAAMATATSLAALGECVGPGRGVCWWDPAHLDEDDVARIAGLAERIDADGPTSLRDGRRYVLLLPFGPVSARSALVAVSVDEGGFDEELTGLMATTATHVASARARLRAEAEVERRLELQEFLNELATAAARATTSDAEDIRTEVLARIAERFDVSAGLWWRSGDRAELDVMVYPDGAVEPLGFEVPITTEWVESVAARGYGFVALGAIPVDVPLRHDPTARLLAVPLGDSSEGYISLIDPLRRWWSHDELGVTLAAARVLHQMTKRVEAERTVHRRLELEAIATRTATRAVDADLDTVTEWIEAILEDIVESFDVAEAALWRVENDHLTCRARRRSDDDGSVPDGAPPVAVLAGLAPGDAESVPFEVAVGPLRDALGFASPDPDDSRSLLVPFGGGSGVLGYLVAVAKRSGDWTRDEVAVMGSIARVFGQLRSRMIVERDLQTRRATEALIAEMGVEFLRVSVDDGSEVVAGWLERLRGVLGVTSIALWEFQPSTRMMECTTEATGGGKPQLSRHSPLPRDHPAIARALDPASDERWRFGDLTDSDGEFADESLVIFPVVKGRDVLLLVGQNADGAEFCDDTVTAFRSAASLLAQLRRRLQLERRSEKRRQADEMLHEIATDFVERSVDEESEAVNGALRRVGEFFGARWVRLWVSDDVDTGAELVSSWADDSTDPTDRLHRAHPLDDPLSRAIRRFEGACVVPATDQGISPEQRARDAVVAPTRQGGGTRGALILTLPRRARDIPDIDIHVDVLDSVAKLLEQLDSRLRAETAVIRRLANEDHLRRFATRLIETPANELDGVRDALEELVAEIGADHASLWRVSPEGDGHDMRMEVLLDVHRGAVRPLAETVRITRSDGPPDPRWADVFRDGGNWPIDGLPSSRRSLLGDSVDPGPRRLAVMGDRLDGDREMSLFVVSRPGERPFDDHELELLNSASAVLGQHEMRVTAERWLTAAFDSAPVAITMRDSEFRLLECNEAYEVFTGRTRADMIGKDVTAVQTPESAARIMASMDEFYAGEHEDEASYQRPDGTIVWATIRSTPVLIPGRREPLLLTHIADITDRRRAREMLEYQASHDELTGLPNRRALVAEIGLELAASNDCAVLVLDLDRFKVVNDSLGHTVGDQLLVTCADRIRLSLRPDDAVCRLGGDEFAILLRAPADEAAAGAVANRLLTLLREPVRVGDEVIFPSASIGIAIPEAADSVEDLLRHADSAMYEAKARGRDRTEAFDASMRTRVSERVRLEAELRRAVDGELLELHYQPEFLLDSGVLVGVEALLRWKHPEQGMLEAATFIGLAEECGLVVDIGRWVLSRAAAQAAEWEAAGFDLTTRVNLSARQLRPGIVGEVETALRDSGLDPTRLCLELTETAIMDDVRESEGILERFRALGVRVAIDDFGTGFSSLAYLKRFSVDILKIDRTFVDQLGVDPDDTAIVQSVIGLARTLRLEVVAEGIEGADQLNELVRLGCNRGQGYHLGSPAPAAEIDRMLSAQRSRG